MVTARMAGFRPGTSPPPVRIPITPFFVFTFAALFLLMPCSQMSGRPLSSYSPLSRAAMNKEPNKSGKTSPAFPKWHSVNEDAFAGSSGPT